MLMFRWRYAGLLALLGLGCSDRDVTVRSADAPTGPLSLVTFNAAIGVGLAPYAEQRLEAIERSLPDLGADVLCLQELWQPSDLERLASNLASEFPYSHRSVSAATTFQGCSDSEAELLLACLDSNCAGVENAGLPLCAIANCASAFTQTGQPCQECIVANQAAPDVSTLIAMCSAKDGSAEAFEEQTGLLLLSRWPLSNTGYLKLESSLADRGVLRAQVQSSGGEVDLYCTHLAASLGEVPYTGAYGSWQGERVAQIEQLLPWVEQTRAPGGKAAFMGDLNCGPATSLARPASPDAFQRFDDAGFIAPYASDDGRCTFCANNPLNGFASDMDEGALIDHVLLSGFDDAASISAQRVLDGPVTLTDGGADIESAHSDHYGVNVMVSWAEPAL